MDEAKPPRSLEDLLAEFDNAMLLTHGLDGRMRSHPMVIVDVHGESTIYLATPLDSLRAAEFARASQVAVVLQSGSRSGCITGTGRIMADRTLLDRLWSASWKIWLPGGPGDPSLCLVAVDAEAAEFWDATEGGSQYAFQGAAASPDEAGPDARKEPRGKTRT